MDARDNDRFNDYYGIGNGKRLFQSARDALQQLKRHYYANSCHPWINYFFNRISKQYDPCTDLSFIEQASDLYGKVHCTIYL